MPFEAVASAPEIVTSIDLQTNTQPACQDAKLLSPVPSPTLVKRTASEDMVARAPSFSDTATSNVFSAKTSTSVSVRLCVILA